MKFWHGYIAVVSVLSFSFDTSDLECPSLTLTCTRRPGVYMFFLCPLPSDILNSVT